MAIHETKKKTALEKRLMLLRQQVYGSEQSKPTIQAVSSDLSYLYQDLTKIALYTSFAIGIQIALFILTKNHILNLNFF